MADFKLILFFYSIQYISVKNVQSGDDKSTTRRTTTSRLTTPTTSMLTTPTTSMTPTTRTTLTSPSPSTSTTPLTATTTSTQKTGATCDLGWIKINDLCYTIVKQIVSAVNAKQFCLWNSYVATDIPPNLEDKFGYYNFLWVNISGNIQACQMSNESNCTDTGFYYTLCSKTVTYVVSPTVTESPCYCPCSVPRLNLTAEEFKESLKEITIDVKNTSKYIRSKISAPDERASSKAIGMVAIVFIVIPFGLLIITDIPTLVCQIMATFKQIRQRIK